MKLLRMRMLTARNLKSDLHTVTEPVVEVLHGATKIVPISSISDTIRKRTSSSSLTLKPISLVEHLLIMHGIG